MIVKKNKLFEVLFLLLLTQSFLAISINTHYSLKTDQQTSKFKIPSSINSGYSDWWESVWVWVDSSGWVNSRAEINSQDLGFGQATMNLFIASYPDVYSIFDHANWWFNPSNDPNDKNSNIEIQFCTTNIQLAENYADLIMQFVHSELTGLQYEYDGTYSWEDWRGDSWVDLTTVRYRASMNWPWFTTFINDEVIPRNIGGLAETINVTDATNIDAWAWPSGDPNNPFITFAFGFSFNYDVYYDLGEPYLGSHNLNISKLINVEKIQRSPNQGGNLMVSVNLPNVTNIAHIPASNTSDCQIFTNYHPPPESWVEHNYYDVSFDISNGVYTTISVSFDFDFIPWSIRSNLRTNLIVDQYGYQFKSIELQGKYSRIIDFESFPNWDSEIVSLNLNFRPFREEMWDSFVLEICYSDYSDHYTAANNLALDISSDLGITFLENFSDSWNWWDYQGIYYEGIRYRFESDDFNQTISQSLLSDSNATSSTPAFANQDLASITEYNQWSVYRPEVLDWEEHTEFRWNPLVEEIMSPTKEYIGTQSGLNIDLLNEWNWPSFPYSSNYSRSEFQITVPYDSYLFYPTENNGYGWHTDIWEDNNNPINEIPFITYRLEIYTEASSLEFNNGTSFTEFGLFLDYTFHDDNEDLIPPNAHIYYVNDTGYEFHDEWEVTETFTFQGFDEHLRVNFNDDSSFWINNWNHDFYFWNSTSSSHEPRFNSSGIQNAKVTAYFSELPVGDPQFERSLSLTLISGNEISQNYNVSWDTLDGFADGEWTLIANAQDSNNNYGQYYGLHGLKVDNYNDTIYTEGPSVTILSVSNVTVSGNFTIRTQVTDDVEVFAIVLTGDNHGWILEDSNNDSIYEFIWNSFDFPEGSRHYFTITAWDMDGHKVITDFWLEVDNIPTGDPPVVEILAPASPNQILSGEYTFRVRADDDLGISSITMKIDEGATYDMDYNSSSNEYYYIFNLSTITNGQHCLHIEVIDIDENQHLITADIDFIVEGGTEGPIVSDPPEWNSEKSELPENLTEYIKNGNLLDYNPEAGFISFKIAVIDDFGISTVRITISRLENFDASTGEPDLNDLSQVLSQSMTKSGSEDGWEIYEFTWDSTSVSDDYYLVEIDVQDTDEVVNHKYVMIVLETDNHGNKDNDIAPGLEIEIVILALITYLSFISIKKRKR